MVPNTDRARIKRDCIETHLNSSLGYGSVRSSAKKFIYPPPTTRSFISRGSMGAKSEVRRRLGRERKMGRQQEVMDLDATHAAKVREIQHVATKAYYVPEGMTAR